MSLSIRKNSIAGKLEAKKTALKRAETAGYVDVSGKAVSQDAYAEYATEVYTRVYVYLKNQDDEGRKLAADLDLLARLGN